MDSVHRWSESCGALHDTAGAHVFGLGEPTEIGVWLLASTAGGPLISLELNDVVDGPDTAVRFWTWRDGRPGGM